MEMENLGLYIHIPFCRSKCYYCDFNSYSGMESMQDSYIDCVIDEIEENAGLLEKYNIRTIFIGGGTPTYLNLGSFERLLNYLKRYCSPGIEYTCEANPGTLNIDKLKMMKENGINRLSVGLQSWDDRILKSLGRIHNLEQFLNNYNDARRIGFNNINIDIMFAVQGQSVDDLRITLDNIINLGPEHISCYSLIIEEGTVFGDRYKAGELKEVDEDTDRDMYYMANEKLMLAGYDHYEISNYAKDGFKSRHNINYWKTGPYLGIGAGAHSYIDGVRFSNELSPEKYISAVKCGRLPIVNEDRLTIQDMMSEYMFMGLRMMEGIDAEEFHERFGKNIDDVYGVQIKDMVKKGLLTRKENIIQLTPMGIDLSNVVFVEFI